MDDKEYYNKTFAPQLSVDDIISKAKKSAEDAVKNGYLYRFRIVKHPKIKS